MKLSTKRAIATLIAVLVGGSILASPASALDRYISVSATGSVKVVPDTVRVNASVAVVASANATALSGASASASKLRAALSKSGIESKYVKSTNLSVYPEYNYTADKGSTLVGYRASQSFEIIIRSAKNAGVVLDAAIAAVDNSLSIDGVTPFVYDNTSATSSARADAVARAKGKATSYAKLLGVSLGKITYLEESSGANNYPVVMAMAKSDAGATQIDLGQQDVTISVNTRWAIA